MNTSISISDEDIKNLLNQIIVHKTNKEDLVEILSSTICSSSITSERFLRCYLGKKLPEIIPDGTIVTISVDDLSYDADKEATNDKFGDTDNRIIATIKGFRGFHDYSNYAVSSKAIDRQGNEIDITSYVSFDKINVVDDF